MPNFGHSFNVVDTGQIVGDIYIQVLEARNHFYFGIMDADWGMYSTMLPEVNNKLLCLTDIEGEGVVLTQLSQCLYLLPKLRLVIVQWPAHYIGVICKRLYGVR